MSELPLTSPKTSGELAASSAASHSKALVEAKYVMAMQRPRNILAVRDKILEACARPGFAASAWYAKPVGNSKVRGPSIRFAETAIQCMTNISIMPSIVYEDREKLVLDVQVLDLESNTSYGDQVTLSKTVERKDKKGREVIGERTNSFGDKVYIVLATEDEMANKTNAAKSKIIRNSGLRLIPQDLIEEAEYSVRETLAKGGNDPAKEKKRMADAFSMIGVKPVELEKYLGHSVDSISPAELADLREVYAALKDGEAKWSDYVSKGERRQPARTVPIDPSADIVPPEKAEAEPTDEESQFMDFIASLDDATDAEILADRREEAMTLLSDATAAKALKAVDVKAAALGLTWNQAKGGYEA